MGNMRFFCRFPTGPGTTDLRLLFGDYDIIQEEPLVPALGTGPNEYPGRSSSAGNRYRTLMPPEIVACRVSLPDKFSYRTLSFRNLDDYTVNGLLSIGSLIQTCLEMHFYVCRALSYLFFVRAGVVTPNPVPLAVPKKAYPHLTFPETALHPAGR